MSEVDRKTKDEVLAMFIKAAEKQKRSLDSAWGHAIFCNYPSDIGNGYGRCNCGISDMLTALKEYQKL